MVDLVLKRDDLIGNNHFLYFSFITQLPCFILGIILYCEKESHALVIKDLKITVTNMCISNCRGILYEMEVFFFCCSNGCRIDLLLYIKNNAEQKRVWHYWKKV